MYLSAQSDKMGKLTQVLTLLLSSCYAIDEPSCHVQIPLYLNIGNSDIQISPHLYASITQEALTAIKQFCLTVASQKKMAEKTNIANDCCAIIALDYLCWRGIAEYGLQRLEKMTIYSEGGRCYKIEYKSADGALLSIPLAIEVAKKVA